MPNKSTKFSLRFQLPVRARVNVLPPSKGQFWKGINPFTPPAGYAPGIRQSTDVLPDAKSILLYD